MAKKKGSTPQSDRSVNMNENEQTEQSLEISPAQPVDQASADQVTEQPVEQTSGEIDPPVDGAAQEQSEQPAGDAPAAGAEEQPAAQSEQAPIDPPSQEQAPIDPPAATAAPIDPPVEQAAPIDPPAAQAAPIDPPAPAIVDTTPVAADAPAEPVVLVGSLPAGASGSAKLCVSELEHYIKEATYALNRRVTDERGAAMQSSLYRALKGAVNAPAEEFHHVMNLFLNTIHHHKDGVFHETKVLHHMPHLNLPSAHITSFKKLVNMFISMADPQGRAATRRQINFPMTLEHKDIKEDARQRVMEFFNV